MSAAAAGLSAAVLFFISIILYEYTYNSTFRQVLVLLTHTRIKRRVTICQVPVPVPVPVPAPAGHTGTDLERPPPLALLTVRQAPTNPFTVPHLGSLTSNPSSFLDNNFDDPPVQINVRHPETPPSSHLSRSLSLFILFLKPSLLRRFLSQGYGP